MSTAVAGGNKGRRPFALDPGRLEVVLRAAAARLKGFVPRARPPQDIRNSWSRMLSASSSAQWIFPISTPAAGARR